MKAVDHSYNSELQNFSANLFANIGLSYFKHTRVYKDYKTIMLLSNPKYCVAMPLNFEIGQSISLVVNGENYMDIFDFSDNHQKQKSIRIYHENKEYLQKFIKNYLALFEHAIKTPTVTNQRQTPKFTKRELECVKLLMSGDTAKITARKLNISPRTVEKYLDNIKEKLGVKRKIEIMSKSKELLDFE